MVCLAKLLNHTGITSEILLASNQNDGETGTEVHDFGNPLQIGKRGGKEMSVSVGIYGPGRREGWYWIIEASSVSMDSGI